MGRAIRSRFASEITVAYDLIACLCASAVVNATNYALSNFDRVEFGGKEDFSPNELNNGLRQFNCVTHYGNFLVTYKISLRNLLLIKLSSQEIIVFKERNGREQIKHT